MREPLYVQFSASIDIVAEIIGTILFFFRPAVYCLRILFPSFVRINLRDRRVYRYNDRRYRLIRCFGSWWVLGLFWKIDTKFVDVRKIEQLHYIQSEGYRWFRLEKNYTESLLRSLTILCCKIMKTIFRKKNILAVKVTICGLHV